MPMEKPKFCLSRADAAHFEPKRGYQDWFKIHNLGLRDATHGAINV